MNFGFNRNDISKLNSLLNIEKLKFYYIQIRNFEDFKIIILKNKLKNLKEIELLNIDYSSFNFSLVNPRPDKIKIFVKGIEIEQYKNIENLLSENQFNYNDLIKKSLECLIQNYENISDKPKDLRIDYNFLMNLVNDELPEDFHNKVKGISNIILEREKVKDEFKLLKFIKDSKARALQIRNSQLTKSFYNQLPNYGESIKDLEFA